MIWEQFETEQFLDSPVLDGFNKKACTMIINEARKPAVREMLPTLSEGDKAGVRYESGTVRMPDCFKRPHALLI
ncbi:hypothetical protein [Desulfospira joergensenii]|uniref:hypothetical protein n=1 Tax=Desulfospira joergensenii TaxID=53329 RepID=UPI0003B5DC09|nr:hypothetical protein [Desulfospira joergensenii]